MYKNPEIPGDIEQAIITPHEHEDDHHKPLWIIWAIEKSKNDNIQEFPAIDSVCDSEESARYHVIALLETKETGKQFRDLQIFVERIPANHRFGSSLGELMFEESMKAADSIKTYHSKKSWNYGPE